MEQQQAQRAQALAIQQQRLEAEAPRQAAEADYYKARTEGEQASTQQSQARSDASYEAGTAAWRALMDRAAKAGDTNTANDLINMARYADYATRASGEYPERGAKAIQDFGSTLTSHLLEDPDFAKEFLVPSLARGRTGSTPMPFASSPLGIFNRETGDVTTPVPTGPKAETMGQVLSLYENALKQPPEDRAPFFPQLQQLAGGEVTNMLNRVQPTGEARTRLVQPSASPAPSEEDLVLVTNPQGKKVKIRKAQLQEALGSGYTQ